jgi:hypothetical protein
MNKEMIVITDGEVVLFVYDSDQECYTALYGSWYWLESGDFQGWVFNYIDDEDGESYDLYIDLENEDEEEIQE